MADKYVEHHPTLTAMEFIRARYPFESDQDLHRFSRFVIHMRSEFVFDYEDTRVFCERSICRLIGTAEFEELMQRVDNYIGECTHA
jgi:hypothetical protein